jgi:predicted component of type VI protein secretion system
VTFKDLKKRVSLEATAQQQYKLTERLHNRGKIAINPDKFDKLITSLRTAVDIDGTLDKESTSYNDIFDAFRLALKFYHFRDSSKYD